MKYLCLIFALNYTWLVIQMNPKVLKILVLKISSTFAKTLISLFTYTIELIYWEMHGVKGSKFKAILHLVVEYENA